MHVEITFNVISVTSLTTTEQRVEHTRSIQHDGFPDMMIDGKEDDKDIKDTICERPVSNPEKNRKFSGLNSPVFTNTEAILDQEDVSNLYEVPLTSKDANTSSSKYSPWGLPRIPVKVVKKDVQGCRSLFTRELGPEMEKSRHPSPSNRETEPFREQQRLFDENQNVRSSQKHGINTVDASCTQPSKLINPDIIPSDWGIGET